ncbi:MAG TPA: PP2C family serine/threonine-protein phosphatase [Acidimicrobiales bacterium]
MGGRLTTVPADAALRCWRTLAATATGAGHLARDEPGEDAVEVRVRDDGAVVIAVADGAGSAPEAREGSAAAVAAAVDACSSGACLEDAFELARNALGDDPPRRATTLLVAVLGADAVEVAQVGDGYAIARRADGSYEVLVPGADREYVNETTFLSSANWRSDLRIGVLPADDLSGVALLTDGLQLVAVELATDTPFPGFFDPVFSWASDEGSSEDDLAAFLASPRIAERTDDDVTLALAVRLP